MYIFYSRFSLPLTYGVFTIIDGISGIMNGFGLLYFDRFSRLVLSIYGSKIDFSIVEFYGIWVLVVVYRLFWSICGKNLDNVSQNWDYQSQ